MWELESFLTPELTCILIFGVVIIYNQTVTIKNLHELGRVLEALHDKLNRRR